MERPAFEADLRPPLFKVKFYNNEPTAIQFNLIDHDTGNPLTDFPGDWLSQYRQHELAEESVDIEIEIGATYVVAHFETEDVQSFFPTGVWDLKYTPTDGEPDTLARAIIELTQNVTRAES